MRPPEGERVILGLTSAAIDSGPFGGPDILYFVFIYLIGASGSTDSRFQDL